MLFIIGRNNATCNDLIGQFNCTCLAGWRGRTCEINIDDCLSQPCQNGGNCTDKVSSKSCIENFFVNLVAYKNCICIF